MDFFSGDFSRHPVISLMSFSTSSAVARNSGLAVALAAVAGAVAACCGRAGEARNKRAATEGASAKHPRRIRERKSIASQDSRFRYGAREATSLPRELCGRRGTIPLFRSGEEVLYRKA